MIYPQLCGLKYFKQLYSFKFLLTILSKQKYLQLSICNTDNLHTVIWFQILHRLVIFDRSVWSRNGSLTVTTALGQSGPGSNDNEERLHYL